MEAGFITIVVIAAIVGTVVGILIEKYRMTHKGSQGILNVDCSDPADGPYLFLELKVPIAEVVSQKRAMLDVNITQYVSQE